MPIKLFSTDWNGTTVHQHTMSDMIRIYIGEAQYRAAKAVFDMQTSGKATMQQAFGTAGPLTRELTLDNACEYPLVHMKFVDGVIEAIDDLADAGVVVISNSTGYMPTLFIQRELMGRDKNGQYKIKGLFGNHLQFSVEGNADNPLPDCELEEMCIEYVRNPKIRGSQKYKEIKATGVIKLGIGDEAAKPALTYRFRDKYYPEIKDSQIAHVGDTIGDGQAILVAAQKGGLGFAFNYNDALEKFLKAEIAKDPSLQGRVHFIDKKGPHSDYYKIIPMIIRR